jgi:hypothetical protein
MRNVHGATDVLINILKI